MRARVFIRFNLTTCRRTGREGNKVSDKAENIIKNTASHKHTLGRNYVLYTYTK